MQTLTLSVAKFEIVTTNKLLVASNVFMDIVAKRKVPVLIRNTNASPHQAAHSQSLYWMTYPQHIYRAHIIAVPYTLVFCDVMLQSLANRYPRVRGTCCHHLQGRRWRILVTWHVIHLLTHCHTPQHWIQLYSTISHNILQDHKMIPLPRKPKCVIFLAWISLAYVPFLHYQN